MSFQVRRFNTLTFIVALTLLAIPSQAENADETKSADDDRVLRKSTIVAADRETVWRSWTTPDGIRSFFAPQADIELRVGGKYEIIIDPDAPAGQRGAEGCRVLSYIPNEMLSFTWNFPPSIPSLRNNDKHTFVVLQFDAIDSTHTLVRLEQRGWQTGEDWDKGYQYFDRAWSYVLNNLTEKVKSSSAGTASATTELRVASVLNAPRSRVWHMLTTKEGLESWATAVAEVDMKVGGKMLTNYDKEQGTTGPDTFTTTILAFEPETMLATQAALPDSVGRLKVVENTWLIYNLTELSPNQTLLELVSCGWQTGGDWDFARTFFAENMPKKLDMLQSALAGESTH